MVSSLPFDQQMTLLWESIPSTNYLQLGCLETDSENGTLYAGDFLKDIFGRDTCQEEKKMDWTEVEPYPWEVTSEIQQILQWALELEDTYRVVLK